MKRKFMYKVLTLTKKAACLLLCIVLCLNMFGQFSYATGTEEKQNTEVTTESVSAEITEQTTEFITDAQLEESTEITELTTDVQLEESTEITEQTTELTTDAQLEESTEITEQTTELTTDAPLEESTEIIEQTTELTTDAPLEQSTEITEQTTELATNAQFEQSTEKTVNSEADIMPMAESPEDIRAFTGMRTGELTHDIRTISLSKSWRGDTASQRPASVAFELYQGSNPVPIETITMTASDAASMNQNTWKADFKGTYPIYDAEGKEISYTIKEAEVLGYRCIQNSDDSTTDTGYENVSVYVPVTEIEDDVDYLVSSGNDGDVNLYRAEAYQTDGILKTGDGSVQAVTDERNIEATDGTLYNDYILTADEIINGENATDYMTWRASVTNDGSAILRSNCYRYWGINENNDEDKYPGYLSTKKNKMDGLCVDKKAYDDANSAPASDKFIYDAATGGFRTAGSDKIVYLYKKITQVDGTFHTAKTNYSFTNWKNSTSTDDPLNPGEIQEPEDYTNVKASKEWEDGAENHTADSVIVVLYANGVAKAEHILNDDNHWNYTFEGLPTFDTDKNRITYTMEERSATGEDGQQLQYVPDTESTTETEKIWLPVDRPSTADGGNNYLVVAFPTTKEEIGQKEIWDDGSGKGSATRNALTSDSKGKYFAMGTKNAGNVGDMRLTVTAGPIEVNGTTYTSYVTDDQVKNTFIWKINYVGTATADIANHANYGPFPRDLFTFQSLSGAGGYLSTQGAMTLDSSIKTDKFENNRNLFAYGMLTNADWEYYLDMTNKDGFNDDKIAHMIGGMDHYGIRADASPGGYNDRGKAFAGMYLYKGVEVTNLSYTVTNKSIEKINVYVNKLWEDHNDTNRPSSIRVELFKNGVSTNQYLNLTADSDWQGQFKDLYKTDTDGNAYTYTVREYVQNSDWYETTYTPVTDDKGNMTVSIKNKKTVVSQEFILQKMDGTTKEKLSGDFSFSLTNDDGSAIDRFTNLRVDENGQIKFSDIPDGTYLLKETNAPEVYAKLPHEISLTISKDGIKLNTTDQDFVELKETDGLYILNVKNYRWITMPETGSTSAWHMRSTALGLLLAGMLLIIILKLRKERIEGVSQEQKK